MSHPTRGTSFDALTFVGTIQCRRCDAKSWPTDAIWVDEFRALASWPATCEHTKDMSWIVDSRTPPARDRTRCGWPTKFGTPCRIIIRDGKHRCHIHENA